MSKHFSTIVVCVIAIMQSMLSAQTPYDSFHPETSRPMLRLERDTAWRQQIEDDNGSFLIVANHNSGIVMLYDLCGDSLVAVADINPDMLLWLSVDPLADKNIAESPYVYCSGRPINKIDPTGLDDIFDISGQFIEHIDNETDYVLIRNNGKLTNITEFSYDKREIGNRTMLKNVLTHYANQVGIFQNISLSDDPKDGEGAIMSTKTSTGVVSGVINHGTLNSNASTASNIINSASHEFFHFLTRTTGPMAELEAISFQMSHDSWTKTTEDFKQGIFQYAIINANKDINLNSMILMNWIYTKSPIQISFYNNEFAIELQEIFATSSRK